MASVLLLFSRLSIKSIWEGLFLLFSLFASIIPLEASKIPSLTSKDTKAKLEEILKVHVSYHDLTPEILTRAFNNYLDQIDPSKTYLLKSEVVKWTSPSSQFIAETIMNIRRENFNSFEQLHDLILPAIERRAALDKQISENPLPKKALLSEFKELDWAETEADLLERISKIHALQFEAAEKLEPSLKAQFMQRVEKRRSKREKELAAPNTKLRQQLVFTLTLKAISSALDSQTLYFTPAEANQFMIQVQQRLFGIGAELRDDLNGFTLVRLLEGGPAKESNKLKPGDKIIAVNEEPVVGMDIAEAVDLIRGPKGTPVGLTILREFPEEKKTEKLDVSIIREEVILKESRLEKSFEPFGDGILGVLHLFSFYQDNHTSSANDLREAIEELKQQHNLKGIVLDLRNNTGGLLPQAVAVTGLFIKKGVVVSVKDNTGAIQHLRNIEGTPAWDGPLVVLTNKLSASAAEIVAQTLQDYGRALIVGDSTTYGKGTFQIFTLESSHYGKINPKGEFKVTKGCYYTVSGKSPQLVGVIPNIEIPGALSYVDIGEKFAKYPLANDEIPSSFQDDLSDVPPPYRNQVIKLYKFNMQPVLHTYSSYLEILKKNSQQRIDLNKNYQAFLKQLEQYKKEETIVEEENFGLIDLQLAESLNVLKDFIVIIKETQEDNPSTRGEIELGLQQATGS